MPSPPPTSGTDTLPPLRFYSFWLGLRLPLLPSDLPRLHSPHEPRPTAPEDAPENELAESGPWRCRGVWSPPVTGAAGQWLPGLSKERRRKGRGEAGLSRRVSGDAGNWQADERAQVGGGGSRVRESRNGGTGRSADSGNGWALRRDPGNRTPPQSLHPPSALCTPPRSAAVPRGAGIRGAVRRGTRWRLRHGSK